MTEGAGGLLVLLAVTQAGLPGARWPEAAQGAVIAALAVFGAANAGPWPFAATSLAVLAATALRWTAPAVRRPASPAMGGAVVAAVCVLVPVLSLLSPAPGVNVLALAVPVLAGGIVLLAFFGREDGGLLALRAAVFAALADGNAVAALPPSVVLVGAAAMRHTPWRIRPSRALLGVVAVGGLALAGLPAAPGVAVAGIAVATVCLHAWTVQRALRPVCAVGLAAALFGCACAGSGPAFLAPDVLLCGLTLNAAGVLSLVRLRPEPLLLAVLIVDASVWSARSAAEALPAGLAVAAWAALLLLWRRPTPGRLASGLSAAHGGVALCAVGLGTAPALYAGVAHMAGHLLAQASLVFGRDRRTALLMLAGLPPSALLVSEWLLLRASGGTLLPVAVVLALTAAAALRWPPPTYVASRRGLAWVAGSAVMATVIWGAAP